MKVNHSVEKDFQGVVTQNDLESTLTELTSRLGFNYYSYLSAKTPTKSLSESKSALFINNYPKEWTDRYLLKDYYLQDPVAVIGSKSRRPFCWGGNSFLKPFDGAQRLVFHEAGEHGIVYGVTFPVHGPGGEVGLFSVVSNDNKSYFLDAVNQTLGNIQAVAVEAHATAMEGLGEIEAEENIELTTREKECLIWTVRGKTSWEISKIINRSTPTVNYHLQKAVKKLGAVNKFQAAIKAYEQGLLYY